MAKAKSDDDDDDKKKKSKPVAKSLDDLKKSICKEHGDGAVMQGRKSIVDVDVFPTYVATIDRALGTGGLPQGRIVELFGLESSGKTTTCLQFIAACQRFNFTNKKRKGVAAFVDAEHAFDPGWAQKCGVDVENLLFSQPDSGEQAFDIVEQMVVSGLVDLVVVDSVAALIPQAELDGDVSDTVIGGQARLMSRGMRRLKGPANKTKTTIVFINQIRQKIGVMYGDPNTTPGGLALKFYASIRAQVNKGSPIKDGKEVVGFRPTIKFIKNKCAAPFTSAEYDICFGLEQRPAYGVDEISSLIEVGVELGAVQKSSSYYIFGDQRINGLEKATAVVRDSQSIQEMLREKIYGSLQDRAALVAAEDDEGDDDLEDDILNQLRDGDE